MTKLVCNLTKRIAQCWSTWRRDESPASLVSKAFQLSGALAKVYTTNEEHDPADLNKAREIATGVEPIPVGILYRNTDVPCYEDLRSSDRLRTAAYVKEGLEAELDKFTIWPQGAEPRRPAS